MAFCSLYSVSKTPALLITALAFLLALQLIACNGAELAAKGEPKLEAAAKEKADANG